MDVFIDATSLDDSSDEQDLEQGPVDVVVADVDSNPLPVFPIEGFWESADQSELLRVDSTQWNGAVISDLSLSEQWLVIGRPDGSFDQLAWTEPSHAGFYSCWTQVGVSYESAIAGAQGVDVTAPAVAGCVGGPWDRWNDTVEIAGEWQSNFGGWVTIWSDSYGPGGVVMYDHDSNWLVIQNSEDDLFAPSLFSKLVWTQPAAAGFFACLLVDGAATLAEALDVPLDEADKDDPNAGCAGGPWSFWSPMDL